MLTHFCPVCRCLCGREAPSEDQRITELRTKTAIRAMGTHGHTVSLHKTILRTFWQNKGWGDFVATVRTKCDFKSEYDVTHGSFRYSQSNVMHNNQRACEKKDWRKFTSSYDEASSSDILFYKDQKGISACSVREEFMLAKHLLSCHSWTSLSLYIVSMHFKLQIQANPKCALTSLCLADTLVRRIDWVGQSAEQAKDLFFTKSCFSFHSKNTTSHDTTKTIHKKHYHTVPKSKISQKSNKLSSAIMSAISHRIAWLLQKSDHPRASTPASTWQQYGIQGHQRATSWQPEGFFWNLRSKQYVKYQRINIKSQIIHIKYDIYIYNIHIMI